MMAAREWSEQNICQLIYQEVTAGATMQQLNDSAKTLVDGTHAGFVEMMGLHSETMRNLEVLASRIVVKDREMKTMRDEVSHVLEDSRSFVTQTEAEQTAARAMLFARGRKPVRQATGDRHFC